MKKLGILIPSLFATILPPVLSLSSCSSTTFVVTLYADKGYFGTSKSITLSGIKPNTKLIDIEGYIKPQLSSDNFRGWIDSNGNYFNEEDYINGNLLLRATYDSDFPVPVSDFENDPWTTICYYANQGLGVLCAAYNQPASWFIGKERTLSVNQQLHKVLVVGTNNEQYGKDGGYNLAALTFQFKNLLSDQNGYSLGVCWSDDNKNVDYWNSGLHEALNGDNPDWHNPGVELNAFEMIAQDNPEWANNIKAVRQTHNICREIPEREEEKIPWIQETHDEKIFCPSLANYFSKTGIYNSVSSLIINPWDLALYCDEGKQYQYYAQNIIKDNRILDKDAEKTIFKGIERYNCLGKTDDYVVCSPTLSSTDLIWIVHVNDEEKENFFWWHEDAQNGGALCPCFCI